MAKNHTTKAQRKAMQEIVANIIVCPWDRNDGCDICDDDGFTLKTKARPIFRGMRKPHGNAKTAMAEWNRIATLLA